MAREVVNLSEPVYEVSQNTAGRETLVQAAFTPDKAIASTTAEVAEGEVVRVNGQHHGRPVQVMPRFQPHHQPIRHIQQHPSFNFRPQDHRMPNWHHQVQQHHPRFNWQHQNRPMPINYGHQNWSQHRQQWWNQRHQDYSQNRYGGHQYQQWQQHDNRHRNNGFKHILPALIGGVAGGTLLHQFMGGRHNSWGNDRYNYSGGYNSYDSYGQRGGFGDVGSMIGQVMGRRNPACDPCRWNRNGYGYNSNFDWRQYESYNTRPMYTQLEDSYRSGVILNIDININNNNTEKTVVKNNTEKTVIETKTESEKCAYLAPKGSPQEQLTAVRDLVKQGINKANLVLNDEESIELRLEIIPFGKNGAEMVHAYAKDIDGKEHPVLRGICNSDGSWRRQTTTDQSTGKEVQVDWYTVGSPFAPKK